MLLEMSSLELCRADGLGVWPHNFVVLKANLENKEAKLRIFRKETVIML